MKRLLAVAMFAALSLLGQPDGDDGEPVAAPEPATIGLMGVGLAAFGYAAWRKNRKR